MLLLSQKKSRRIIRRQGQRPSALNLSPVLQVCGATKRLAVTNGQGYKGYFVEGLLSFTGIYLHIVTSLSKSTVKN
jgi:hypothetical protein